ncbi:polysaccharide deacetylase family protein [Flavivirga eckloniae]|uniref:Polysaccharide deacetylase family protein n=1 Tax=Flavivirga eckloniae TaxID=1803846 RepID=A0A2K9PPD3_9FLAO|nr:polysaccharide deacetylase family protein [Flavivirga eckloniae]AUP78931.1 polysaccharide deacetylase family protein [Flavivirga eckloniae]
MDAFIPVKTPLLLKKVFPNYIWNMVSNSKEIYLTFDDGPTPEITNWVLDTLKEYKAKATFFCIGNNIEKHPDIFLDILAAGHSIGNHTYNHLKGWKTKTADYLKNVSKTQDVIERKIPNSEFGIKNLFRPPYGQITPKQGKKLIGLDYKIIMWDVLSFDWNKKISKEACLNNITGKTTNGSIIVFHDSVKASKNMQYALPKVLKHFSMLGYSFKAI